MKRFNSYEKNVIARTITFDERMMVNHRVSLRDLTVEAGIQGNVMSHLYEVIIHMYCVCSPSLRIYCVCVLKEAKDTQEINSGGFSNNTMASDFCTPQFHAVNDGSSVISNAIIYGVLELLLMVTIYYILLCIRVLSFL